MADTSCSIAIEHTKDEKGNVDQDLENEEVQ